MKLPVKRLSGLASSVVSLETFLHVSRELGQILGFVEHSAEQNYGDLALRHFRDLSEFYQNLNLMTSSGLLPLAEHLV